MISAAAEWRKRMCELQLRRRRWRKIPTHIALLPRGQNERKGEAVGRRPQTTLTERDCLFLCGASSTLATNGHGGRPYWGRSTERHTRKKTSASRATQKASLVAVCTQHTTSAPISALFSFSDQRHSRYDLTTDRLVGLSFSFLCLRLFQRVIRSVV